MRIALIAIAALCGAATVAEAAPKRYRDDIVVTKRSYLDAGVLVKPGSLGATNYVTASQYATPPYANINSRFGGETLPARGYLPNCCDVPFSRFSE
jgi:hypothetical protein